MQVDSRCFAELDITVSWQVDKCQEKLADLMTHSLLLLWSVQIDFKRFSRPFVKCEKPFMRTKAVDVCRIYVVT